jgi:hypothetical protein
MKLIINLGIIILSLVACQTQKVIQNTDSKWAAQH